MRLLVHVEGQTEETFVNEILREHLLSHRYESVSARIIGNARLRRRRGGIRPWASVRKEIVNHLREDDGCVTTTMVDFYGLPQHGDDAWPGRDRARGTVQQKAACVESAMLASVAKEIGADFRAARFIPFVMMHEFEGLLFSDCARMGGGIGRPDLAAKFQEIRDEFDTPEEINDLPVSCPSSRVERLFPGYEKPLHGNLAILEIGIEPIRAMCPHFNGWLSRLESLTA